jgi:hypothetical protein
MITVGSIVKCLLPCDGKKSVQYERGKVIYTGRRALVEFDSNILGHDGHGLSKPKRCWMIDFNFLKLI